MSRRSRSSPAVRQTSTRGHLQTNMWQRDIDNGNVHVRRDIPTSIWEERLPDKRYLRRLSSSNVGLAGNSPAYVQLAGISKTKEEKCLELIELALQLGTVETLWKIYIESSAWNQDPGAEWPVPNREFVRVRKAMERGLRKQIREALASDLLEDLEQAAVIASNKVEILAFQGNAQFPELEKVYSRIIKLRKEAAGSAQKPAVPTSEKMLAEKSLAAALEAKSGEGLSKAISQSIEAGVDVTEAARYLKFRSSYFSRDRKEGLFEKSCFIAQKRVVHILNLGPEMDLNLLQRLLQVHGVAMKYYDSVKLLFKPPQDRESRAGMSIAASLNGKKSSTTPFWLEEPKKHTVWIISGAEPGQLADELSNVSKLVDFNRRGGGLGIIGSGNRGGHGAPLIDDANVMLKALGLERMWGHSEGRKSLISQSNMTRGINKAHPVLSNVPKLDEGFSLTTVAESVLKQGYVELQRGTNGKLLTCVREPSRAFSGNSGPIVLHGSASQLLGSKEGVGHQQWICNLFLYSCMRAEDIIEDFDFGEGSSQAEVSEESEDEDDEVGELINDRITLGTSHATYSATSSNGMSHATSNATSNATSHGMSTAPPRATSHVTSYASSLAPSRVSSHATSVTASHNSTNMTDGFGDTW